MTNGPGPLDVVVFSCGSLGAEVATQLLKVPSVASVSLITAPYQRRPLTLAKRIRTVFRNQGAWGLAVAAAQKILPFLRDQSARLPEEGPGPLHPAIRHAHFRDFHDAECLETLRQWQPDLGVVAGTYILKPEVFAAPRLGSINLHSGKVPEYRGAAPAFWELYHGEPLVGITIHRVHAAVDAGEVLMQELFPLETAPAGDPMVYVETYRRNVLRPNGIRMLVDTVARIAAGTASATPQDHGRSTTYRTPDHKSIRELRARVKERRRTRREA